MRATSKRLCFIASMALSNKTLSGCFVPTLANGFTDFLFVHAAVIISTTPRVAMNELRLNIKPRICFVLGQPPPTGSRLSAAFDGLKPSPAPRPSPPSAAPPHSFLDRQHRTRRCPPLIFLHPPAPHRPRCRVPRRHLLRCGR